ncbi:MAG: ASCH domain-containing protein [Candidatus Dormibacteria bacterium]
MKALTIRQPWASLLVAGCKVYEYRSWDTRYRDLVAIHAGTKLEKRERQALDHPEVLSRPIATTAPFGRSSILGRHFSISGFDNRWPGLRCHPCVHVRGYVRSATWPERHPVGL